MSSFSTANDTANDTQSSSSSAIRKDMVMVKPVSVRMKPITNANNYSMPSSSSFYYRPRHGTGARGLMPNGPIRVAGPLHQRHINVTNTSVRSVTTWVRPPLPTSKESSKVKVPQSPLKKPSTSSSASSSSSSLTNIIPIFSGAIKPVVRLGDKMSTKKNAKNNSIPRKQPYKLRSPSHYKLDRRNKGKKAKKSPNSFSIRKYSLKRVRKTSLSPCGSPKARKFNNFRGYDLWKTRKAYKLVNANYAPQNLKSTSNPLNLSTVRRAAKMIQRSKKVLSKSKRKKQNTFCSFYNKFGVCNRKKSGNDCKFIHDPRQVTICSRFLNTGHCNTEGCTLSHDISLGKVPPCNFFRKGSCTKIDCPYRHVPFSSEDKRRGLTKSKLSHTFKKKGALLLGKTESEAVNSGVNEEPVPRYYELSPNSQPIISVIPRRLRKEAAEIESQSTDDDSSSNDESDSSQESDSNESSVLISSDDASITSPPEDSNNATTQELDRRTRLLQKVSQIKNPANQEQKNCGDKKEMPKFLKFN